MAEPLPVLVDAQAIKPDPEVDMDDAKPADPAPTVKAEPEAPGLTTDQPQSGSLPQPETSPSADAENAAPPPPPPADGADASAASAGPSASVQAQAPGVTLSTEEEEAALEASGSGSGSGNGSGNGTAPGNGAGEGAGTHGAAPVAPASVSAPPHAPTGPRAEAIPEDACETLYIHNLNERVQLPVLQQTLLNLFKPYRPLTPITAHRNVRMRGQAFVSFADKETANRARREVHEFPLYGRPMMLAFARGRADAVVVKKDGEEGLEVHKKARLEEKKRKRRDNPIRRKEVERRQAERDGTAGVAQPGGIPGLSLGVGGPVPGVGAGAGAGGPAKKAKMALPDEYLPPNNILFIQNLPDGTTSEDLREVFEVHPGLVEIRTIPTKKDIAFIEYADEARAIVAKEALHNFKIDGETKMKVTYARK